MPEPAPPSDALGTPGRCSGPLTPAEIESILTQFRSWLERCAHVPAEEPPDSEPEIDLATVVAAFTALRHEVNLQTKATRSQTEQTAAALTAAQDALDRLESQPATASTESDDFLMALLESVDALSRAERGLSQTLEAAANPRRSWFGSDRRIESMREALAASVEGLRLTHQRLVRTLETHGVAAVPTVGLPFDPVTMEALEGVPTPGKTPGTVIEEVRRGYSRHGDVIRCAIVKVAQ